RLGEGRLGFRRFGNRHRFGSSQNVFGQVCLERLQPSVGGTLRSDQIVDRFLKVSIVVKQVIDGLVSDDLTFPDSSVFDHSASTLYPGVLSENKPVSSSHARK